MAAYEIVLSHPAEPAGAGGRQPPALVIAELYEQHHRTVSVICRLLLRNSGDAEDATQQTFLSAYGSLIDGTVPERAAPWLATIARRECWARSAQRRRQPHLLDEAGVSSPEAEPLEAAIRNTDLSAIWQAINQLPRQQRKVFLMREFLGLSYGEVAEALGASESAIESLLVRARRRLRDQLEPVLHSANALVTVLVLFHSKLARLVGGSRPALASAGKAAAVPTTLKLGATAVSVVLGMGSTGLGLHPLLQFERDGHPTGRRTSAPLPAQAGRASSLVTLARFRGELARAPQRMRDPTQGAPEQRLKPNSPTAATPGTAPTTAPSVGSAADAPSPTTTVGSHPNPPEGSTPPAGDAGSPADGPSASDSSTTGSDANSPPEGTTTTATESSPTGDTPLAAYSAPEPSADRAAGTETSTPQPADTTSSTSNPQPPEPTPQP